MAKPGEEPRTFTEAEVKAAFWKVFHRSGELWFPYNDGGDQGYCERVTEEHWDDFRDALGPANPVAAALLLAAPEMDALLRRCQSVHDDEGFDFCAVCHAWVSKDDLTDGTVKHEPGCELGNLLERIDATRAAVAKPG